MIERPLDKLLDILVPQYQDSTNFIEYLTIFTEQMNEIHIALEDAKTGRYLDNAVGEQLDDIGIIVGANRGTFESTPQEFFGFDQVIGALPFGTIGNAITFATEQLETGLAQIFQVTTPPIEDFLLRAGETDRFRSLSDKGVTFPELNDIDYKGNIQAKIIKNFKSATVENTISAAIEILGENTVVYITEGTLTFNLHFPSPLSFTQKTLIATPGVVPRPLGILVTFSDIDGPFVN